MDYRDILATRLKPFRIEAYENYVINGLTYIQSSSTILEQLNYEKSRSLDVSLYALAKGQQNESVFISFY